MAAKPGAGDDVEMILGQPCDGQISLDPAARVQKLGIGDPPRRAADMARTDPGQRGGGPRPRKLVFREGGLVEQACMGAHMGMFGPDRLKPVLAAHRIDVARLGAFGGEPVWPLPPQFGAEDGAMSLQPLIKRRDKARAARGVFLMREADGVMLAVSFQRAVLDPFAILVEARKAQDIHGPEIQRGLARHRPFGQNPARPTARGDAEGVEPRADIHVGAFRRATQNEIAVRGEAF